MKHQLLLTFSVFWQERRHQPCITSENPEAREVKWHVQSSPVLNIKYSIKKLSTRFKYIKYGLNKVGLKENLL